ncbi:hypothetical protein VNO80_06679 [Phaseolus coccineus]|uniref:Uncharacterized protein n=1 Tax=Phaseolus coccineus TaxID=3886 RepID=A0AAN9RIX9_PHACN
MCSSDAKLARISLHVPWLRLSVNGEQLALYSLITGEEAGLIEIGLHVCAWVNVVLSSFSKRRESFEGYLLLVGLNDMRRCSAFQSVLDLAGNCNWVCVTPVAAHSF